MRRKKIHSCVHEQFTCGKNGIELKVLTNSATDEQVHQQLSWSPPRQGPVTNFDEIPFHFINCIHNHLCTKVKTEGGIPSTFTPSNSSMNTHVKSVLNGSQAPPSNPGYAQYSTVHSSNSSLTN
ncbi:replication protein A 32 kDa subunit A [Trifolium repens]|nr:replication protein A 32 kDa subunit A [Trifolium repens]